MRARLNTAEYEFAHGRRPRGRGHWALEIRCQNGQCNFTGTGTLSDMIRVALANVREFKAVVGRVEEITVLP